MANLRALLLTPDFPPMTGGIELVMRRLVQELRTVDVQIVTLGVADAEEYDRRERFDVIRVASKRERNRAAVAMLNTRGLYEGLRTRPDLVISGHAVVAPAAQVLRRVLRTPSVQYVHAEEFRDRPLLAARAVRAVDGIVAVSRYAAGLARGAGGSPASIHCINPGVDLPVRSNAAKADRPTLLTVARLHDREKGHDVVLRAMPLILERVPEAQWIVIGDGRLRNELEALARQHGVEGSVRFLGRVSDEVRNDWLARSHVFVLPNRAGEGFGIVFLEAAANELPVVAGAVGGALDAVVDQETGLLIDANDHRAVARAVSELLLDPQRSHAMGRAGLERARTFTWRRHAEAVERVLIELSHRDPRAPD